MPAPRTNLLLECLSAENRNAILALAKEMPLPIRHSLQSQEEFPRYAYFLTSGVASVVINLLDGDAGETAIIGREVMVNSYSLLGSSAAPSESFIQVSATGYRVPFGPMKDLFLQSEEIRTRILECVQQLAMTTSQIAACNNAHESEPRLARWLLMVQDRTQENTFQLTQEFLAEMLGTRRTTVALAAGALQRSGFIEYSRGRVTIVSREHLETVACDCYGVTQRLLLALYR